MLTKKILFAKSKHPYQRDPWINIAKLLNISIIGVRARGAGGAAAPPVSKIFGQNAKNSGNKETINDGIEK